MSDVPEACPVCGTSIPDGATRCPGCARVFGEANRCPHCHAIAAVRPSRGGYVCAACNKPRERRVGTTVVGGEGEPFGGALEPGEAGAIVGRSAGFSLRAFGIASLVAGLVGAGAVLALLPIGAATVVVAVAVGVAGVGLGGLSLRAGSRAEYVARQRARTELELAVHRLAKQRGGTLTATDVAESLRVDVQRADALLTQLVGDGSKVQVDVSGDGVVLYRFLEVIAGPRVRVAADEELEARFDELEAREREAEERERAR